MKKTIRLIFLLLLIPKVCVSAPAITTVDGSSTGIFLTDGATSTAIGTSFGIKSPAAPVNFLDFEDGVIGENLNLDPWSSSSDIGESNWPQYTDELVYTGNRSMLFNPGFSNRTSSIGRRVGADYVTTQKMYITYNSYKFLTYDGTEQVSKFFRLRATYSQLPEFGLVNPTGQPAISVFNQEGQATCTGSGAYGVTFPKFKWSRDEGFVDSGTFETADSFWFYRNHDNGVAITEYGQTGCTMLTGTNGLYTWQIGKEFAAQQKHYIDNLYIDVTQARIEIGNNINFDDCTVREIQVPTGNDWNNEADFVVRQGTLSDGDNYLFLIDEDGNVSDQDTGTAGSQGKIITFIASTNPIVTLQADKQATSPTTYTGSFTVETGRTASTVVSSNGFTVTCDDGDCTDETTESFTVSGVTVPITDVITVTDSSAETGNDSITITLPVADTTTAVLKRAVLKRAVAK